MAFKSNDQAREYRVQRKNRGLCQDCPAPRYKGAARCKECLRKRAAINYVRHYMPNARVPTFEDFVRMADRGEL